MKVINKFKTCLLVASLNMFSTAAYSAQVMVSFAGVTTHDEIFSNPLHPDGTNFSGYFMYDPGCYSLESSYQYGGGESTSYYSSACSQIESVVTFNSAGTNSDFFSLESTSGAMSSSIVVQDSGAGSTYEYLSVSYVQYSDEVMSGSSIGRDSRTYFLDFIFDVNHFNDSSLPGSLDFSDSTGVDIVFVEAHEYYDQIDDIWLGELTARSVGIINSVSIASAPIPSAALSFITGFLALVGVAVRKK